MRFAVIKPIAKHVQITTGAWAVGEWTLKLQHVKSRQRALLHPMLPNAAMAHLRSAFTPLSSSSGHWKLNCRSPRRMVGCRKYVCAGQLCCSPQHWFITSRHTGAGHAGNTATLCAAQAVGAGPGPGAGAGRARGIPPSRGIQPSGQGAHQPPCTEHIVVVSLRSVVRGQIEVQ